MKKLMVFLCLFVVAAAVSETNAPSVYFANILGNFKVDAGGHYVMIGKIWASNLPSDQTGGKVVLSKSGAGIYEFPWTAGSYEAPDTEMNIAQPNDLRTGQFEGMPKIDEPGDYTLDFFVGDKKFYSYPFKVTTIASDDGPYVFMDGAWSDWGYIYYPDGDPNRELEWRLYLRNYGVESSKVVRVAVEIVRDKDKKLICSANPNINWTLSREWQRFQFQMMNPPNHPSGENYTKAKYLLEADGAYTLTVKIGGQPYGVWKFNVKGGKLEYTGRTLQGKTDPLSFIYGGASAFWYERQK